VSDKTETLYNKNNPTVAVVGHKAVLYVAKYIMNVDDINKIPNRQFFKKDPTDIGILPNTMFTPDPRGIK
jgi:hypothetical protein